MLNKVRGNILILLAGLISMSVKAYDLNFDNLLQKLLKDQPELIPNFKHILDLRKRHLLESGSDNSLKYELYRSRSCVEFITFGAELPFALEGIAKIHALENRIKSNLNFGGPHDAQKRKLIIKGSVAQSWKYCIPQLSADYIDKRTLEINNYAEARSLDQENQTQPNLSFHHPLDRLLLKKIIDEAPKEKIKEKGYRLYMYETYLERHAYILEKKAKEQFLPNIDKNCPGLVDFAWETCLEDHRYPSGEFSNIPKMYCLLDYKEAFDKKCYDNT